MPSPATCAQARAPDRAISGAPSGPGGVPKTSKSLIPLFWSAAQLANWLQSDGRGGLAPFAQRSEAKFCQAHRELQRIVRRIKLGVAEDRAAGHVAEIQHAEALEVSADAPVHRASAPRRLGETPPGSAPSGIPRSVAAHAGTLRIVDRPGEPPAEAEMIEIERRRRKILELPTDPLLRQLVCSRMARSDRTSFPRTGQSGLLPHCSPSGTMRFHGVAPGLPS